MRIIISAALLSLALAGAAHAAPTSTVSVTYDPAQFAGCDVESRTIKLNIDYPCRSGGSYRFVQQGNGITAIRTPGAVQPVSAVADIPAAGPINSVSSGVPAPGCVKVVDPRHPDWFWMCKIVVAGRTMSWQMRDRTGVEIPGATIAEDRPQVQTASSSDDCDQHLKGRITQSMAYRQGTETGCIAVHEKSRLGESLALVAGVVALDALASGGRGGYGRGYAPYYDTRSYGYPVNGYGYNGRNQSMERPGDIVPGYGGNYVRR